MELNIKRKPSGHQRRIVSHRSKKREFELKIESLTNAGDGLGRVDERVVFVPYTMPGDTVLIEVVQEKKAYILGKIKEILQPSPERIEPKCEYFTLCGGCDWQHVPYLKQLDAKSEQLSETLKRIGELPDVSIEPIIPCEEPYNYRNRIQGEIRDGKFNYQRRRSNDPIAVDQCVIANEKINQFLANESVNSPDQNSSSGGVNSHSGRVEIAVVNHAIEVLPLNENHSTEMGFRQINTGISNKLTSLLLKTIESSQCQVVNDMYCGRGEWTITIAEQHPNIEVTGVDSAEDNIDAARTTATVAKLQNIHFKHDKVEKVIAKLPIKDSVCIVDPPRAGLDKAVSEALCANQAKHLLYISCHPATLARDLKLFVASGYVIKLIQPLDMFPQTAHLECFVHLQANE